MTNIAVRRANENQTDLPVFDDLSTRLDKVRRRAFEIFTARGFGPGRELEDWFDAESELGWPAAELIERNGEYEVDMTVAGFTPGEIEVTACPGRIIVRAAAEKKAERKGANEKVLWSEFGRSEVCREVALPADVDLEKVTANLSNGLLKVHAPKSKAIN